MTRLLPQCQQGPLLVWRDIELAPIAGVRALTHGVISVFDATNHSTRSLNLWRGKVLVFIIVVLKCDP